MRCSGLPATFYFTSVGFACFIGSISAIIQLQSSINVKQGLGPLGVLVLGLVGSASAVFFCPIFLKWLGRKRTLVFGECLSLGYTLANYYPNWWTIMSGSVMYGLGDVLIWTSASAIVASLRGEDGVMKSDQQNDLAMFLAIIALGEGIAGIISEGILRGMKSKQENATAFVNGKLHNISECGAADCPAKYAFAEYSPVFEKLTPSEISLSILLSIFLAMQLLGILLHALFLPKGEKSTAAETKDFEETPLTSSSDDKNTIFRDLSTVLTNIRKHLSSVEGILTIPLYLQHGLFGAVIWCEFTRAFVSCVIGVEEIGICGFIVVVATFLTCFVISKCTSFFGLKTIIVASVMFEVMNYVICLLWIPSTSTLFVPFVLAVSYGICQGFRRTLSMLSAANYFSDMDTSYCVQNSATVLGTALGGAFSYYLCISTVLYIVLTNCLLSSLLVGIVEIRHRREEKQ